MSRKQGDLKPIRFPGRPHNSAVRESQNKHPELHETDFSYIIRDVSEQGKKCVELLRCIAGVCEVISKQCEASE